MKTRKEAEEDFKERVFLMLKDGYHIGEYKDQNGTISCDYKRIDGLIGTIEVKYIILNCDDICECWNKSNKSLWYFVKYIDSVPFFKGFKDNNDTECTFENYRIVERAKL